MENRQEEKGEDLFVINKKVRKREYTENRKCNRRRVHYKNKRALEFEKQAFQEKESKKDSKA